MKLNHLLVSFCLILTPLYASETPLKNQVVTMHKVSKKGIGKSIGTITFEETSEGLKITPNLSGLTPGQHGFHVHEYPSCGLVQKEDKTIVVAGAAGPHYDPGHTESHQGPEGQGHLGDLPFLEVDKKGKATQSVLKESVTLKDYAGRSLILHEKADNYTDSPENGGSGPRIACGLIQ